MRSSLSHFNIQTHRSYTKHQAIDPRPELGELLEPYAMFDQNVEKFCCRKCGGKFETYRGIDAHLATTSCGN